MSTWRTPLLRACSMSLLRSSALHTPCESVSPRHLRHFVVIKKKNRPMALSSAAQGDHSPFRILQQRRSHRDDFHPKRADLSQRRVRLVHRLRPRVFPSHEGHLRIAQNAQRTGRESRTPATPATTSCRQRVRLADAGESLLMSRVRARNPRCTRADNSPMSRASDPNVRGAGKISWSTSTAGESARSRASPGRSRLPPRSVPRPPMAARALGTTAPSPVWVRRPSGKVSKITAAAGVAGKRDPRAGRDGVKGLRAVSDRNHARDDVVKRRNVRAAGGVVASVRHNDLPSAHRGVAETSISGWKPRRTTSRATSPAAAPVRVCCRGQRG